MSIKKAETSIILFDEIDKLLSHHDGQSILHQLLRIIEGSIVPIDDHKSEERLKEIKNISTHQMLFIFAGSFQKVIDQKSNFLDDNNTVINISDIEETGLPKELLGRINKIVTLNSLTRENYKEILLNSRNSPLEQIKSMIKINQQDFLIDDVIIESILDQAENSPYGARSLKQIIWNHFESILYEAPNYQTPVDHKPECWVNAIIKFNHTNKTLSVKNSEKEAVATTPTATKLLNTLPNSIKQKVMNGQLIRVTAYVENGDLVKIKA